MLRNKEQNNTWPAFVDLFSNLTIIMLFLLIVFVLLSSTTRFLTQPANDETLRELTERAASQDALLEQLTARADNLLREKDLLAAQTARLETQISEQTAQALTREEQMAAQLTALQTARDAADASNTAQVAASELEKKRLLEELENLRGTLRTQTEQGDTAREMTAEQLRVLSDEISRLSNALAESEQRAAEREVQYIELSSRFNRALADKLAEMGDLREYQSMFTAAIRKSLGDTGMIKMDEDRFTLPSDILFAQGSYEISKEGREQLKQISGVIKEIYATIPTNVSWAIRVDGHTDNVPVKVGSSLRDNTQLSLMRARAVVDELVKNGIDKRLLIPSGFGEQYPVAMGDTAASLQKNRRIELRLVNP